MRATARSCSSGASSTTVDRQSSARATTSATAAGSLPACGVTAQGRPSKSAALAASGPERSLPAIGCEPTYLARAAASTVPASSRRGADFTEPTSVTTACVVVSASATAAPRWSGGTATTTSCGGPRARRDDPAPRPEAVRTCSGETSLSSTSRPARRAASAIDVPRRPVPTTRSGPVSEVGHASGTERTRVRSLRSDAAPCR